MVQGHRMPSQPRRRASRTINLLWLTVRICMGLQFVQVDQKSISKLLPINITSYLNVGQLRASLCYSPRPERATEDPEALRMTDIRAGTKDNRIWGHISKFWHNKSQRHELSRSKSSSRKNMFNGHSSKHPSKLLLKKIRAFAQLLAWHTLLWILHPAGS